MGVVKLEIMQLKRQLWRRPYDRFVDYRSRAVRSLAVGFQHSLRHKRSNPHRPRDRTRHFCFLVVAGGSQGFLDSTSGINLPAFDIRGGQSYTDADFHGGAVRCLCGSELDPGLGSRPCRWRPTESPQDRQLRKLRVAPRSRSRVQTLRFDLLLLLRAYEISRKPGKNCSKTDWDEGPGEIRCRYCKIHQSRKYHSDHERDDAGKNCPNQRDTFHLDLLGRT